MVVEKLKIKKPKKDKKAKKDADDDEDTTETEDNGSGEVKDKKTKKDKKDKKAKKDKKDKPEDDTEGDDENDDDDTTTEEVDGKKKSKKKVAKKVDEDAECMTIYSKCDYKGSYAKICGTEPFDFNYDIKSIKIPKGKCITLFHMTCFHGFTSVLTKNVPCFEDDKAADAKFL